MNARQTLLPLLLVLPLASSATLSVTPVIYYPLDADISTLIADNLPHDGAYDLSGAGGGAPNYQFGAGKFGLALTSSATGGGTPRGDATNHDATQAGTGDWSVSFWVRSNTPGDTDNFHRMISKAGRAEDANNAPGWQIYRVGGDSSSAPFEISFSQTTATTREKVTSASGGTWDGTAWNHMALIRDGATATFWLNGTLSATLSLAGGAGGNYGVGAGTFFREFQLGPEESLSINNYGIDDLAFFQDALAPDDISQIYNGGTGATIAVLMVPEPSVSALMIMGALALARRRR